jgi:hypothetical protein
VASSSTIMYQLQEPHQQSLSLLPSQFKCHSCHSTGPPGSNTIGCHSAT